MVFKVRACRQSDVIYPVLNGGVIP